MSLPQLNSSGRFVCPRCRSVFRSAFKRCPTDGAKLQPLEGDPLLGMTFADRYVIEACIGEGGMGRVYRARHKRVSRRFAVKVLFGDLAADGRMQTRFANEAEAASRLTHRNLVSVQDFGETPERQLYLVMDYVEGISLKSLIAEQAPLEASRAANLLRQMAGGLRHAHESGLVHRDFKPENVIISRDDEGELAKILDFGLARIVDASGSHLGQSLTTEGLVMGTPAYMSPEHATGEKIDHRTDLFSLGVVLYEMLSGNLPFDGTPFEIARRNVTAKPPPISERTPGLIVDSHLELLAFRLMAKSPDKRFPDAVGILQSLAEHPTLEPEIRSLAELAVAEACQEVSYEDTVVNHTKLRLSGRASAKGRKRALASTGTDKTRPSFDTVDESASDTEMEPVGLLTSVDLSDTLGDTLGDEDDDVGGGPTEISEMPSHVIREIESAKKKAAGLAAAGLAAARRAAAEDADTERNRPAPAVQDNLPLYPNKLSRAASTLLVDPYQITETGPWRRRGILVGLLVLVIVAAMALVVVIGYGWQSLRSLSDSPAAGGSIESVIGDQPSPPAPPSPDGESTGVR
ncbi:MAG: serine/threonine-protein kinase [Myxococcota bacterium]